MSEESQRETIAFLIDVCARAGDSTPPMSTHISRIFFAGETVYKLKRAVQTSYLDFSTSDKRLAACESELSLNRRTAPALYRGASRITREPSGLAFDGEGETVEAVVVMQRFDQSSLFDAMAQRGALTEAQIEALARRIAAFHGDAAPSKTYGGATAMRDILAANEAELRGSFLAQEQNLSPVCKSMRAALAAHAPLLNARQAAGKVRRCHGDLTLRNIALIEGDPTPFDCLEFDEALATIDVLYDLAFTLMDLHHRSRGDLANVLFNRYFDVVDESDGLPLLPLFIAMRAIIRAHVTARMSDDAASDEQVALRDEARAYLALAGAAMQANRPVLIGVGGLSGSGKSTVSAALAPLLSPMPGARILSSDRIRKAMFGAAPTQRLPPDAYAPEVSKRVYAAAREQAQKAMEGGYPAICDAVFDREPDRAALKALAAKRQIPFQGVWLETSGETLAARVAARSGDPSDANVDVLRAQEAKLAASRESIDWTRFDAAAAPRETAQRIVVALGV